MHPCQVSDEVDGTNHKTSHDGMFKVVKKIILLDVKILIMFTFR